MNVKDTTLVPVVDIHVEGWTPGIKGLQLFSIVVCNLFQIPFYVLQCQFLTPEQCLPHMFRLFNHNQSYAAHCLSRCVSFSFFVMKGTAAPKSTEQSKMRALFCHAASNLFTFPLTQKHTMSGKKLSAISVSAVPLAKFEDSRRQVPPASTGCLTTHSVPGLCGSVQARPSAFIGGPDHVAGGKALQVRGALHMTRPETRVDE